VRVCDAGKNKNANVALEVLVRHSHVVETNPLAPASFCNHCSGEMVDMEGWSRRSYSSWDGSECQICRILRKLPYFRTIQQRRLYNFWV